VATVQAPAPFPAEPPTEPKIEVSKAEAPTPVADEQAAVDDRAPNITPQAGERYIQVSALTAEAAGRYIKQLRQAKLEPHVAPGPRPELWRVLIGPFADQGALTQTKSDLDRAGIKNFVRKY
jgi:cell division septation protein DedD